MIPPQPKKYLKNPIFISYTSLSDFIKCHRAYYLKNIYRDSKTGNRILIASPYMSLGSVVHDSVKWILDMGGQVTAKQAEEKFRNFWLKFRGKRGGFETREDEAVFGRRGLNMLENFFKNKNVLEKAVPGLVFPKYLLADKLVLIGNFDFVGEREDRSLHVVDFKTGTKDEKDPLQLYIYAILAESNYQKPVSTASYWYLDRDDKPRPIVLDLLEPQLEWLKEKAGQVKQAIEKGEWVCLKNCRDCQAYQAILEGKGEFQFTDEKFKKDIYFLAL